MMNVVREGAFLLLGGGASALGRGQDATGVTSEKHITQNISMFIFTRCEGAGSKQAGLCLVMNMIRTEHVQIYPLCSLKGDLTGGTRGETAVRWARM